MDGEKPDAAALRKRRATIKSSCTRIKTYVDSISSITPTVMAHLEERKTKLDSSWSDYDSIQSRLEIQDDDEAHDRAVFEEAFYALSAKMRELLKPSAQVEAVSLPSTSRDRNASNSFSHVKLPKLNLPTFTGKYDEWFPFFDTFNSVIHTNASLNDIQRFQYLRASLSGDASHIISSLEISDSNYKVAWNLLKERYDNKRVIVQSHIKAIMELPSMTKENHNELRQVADGAAKHLQALQALKRPTNHWDDLITHILSSKLDSLTLREWQNSLTGTELPTLKQFFYFITHRCQMLEATNKSSVVSAKGVNTKTQSNVKRQSSCVATVKTKCNFCSGEHSIYYCKKFIALSVPQRISEVRGRKLCANCLRSSSHSSNKCTSGQCRVCQGKHNTLLHAESSTAVSTESSSQAVVNSANSKPNGSPATSVTHALGLTGSNHIMLSTAVAYVFDSKGLQRSCRVLLDCGSQANFISRKFLTILNLRPRPVNVSISGVNGIAAASTQAVQVKLQSRVNSYTVNIDCIVADHVTDKLPAFTLMRSEFDLPNNLELADPRFHVSAEVDLLIGAELFWDLMCVGQVKSSDKHPTLQKTRLGWILAGRLGNPESSPVKLHTFHASVTNEQLHEQVSRFWETEGVREQSSNYTMEENKCEQHFLDNVARDLSGRYIVKLPIKEQGLHKLGESRSVALKRFTNLEKRFKSDSALKIQYAQFLDEYRALGHMRLVESPPDESVCYYLPHHCVIKRAGQSSKIRVVFDASCKSNTGVSLNDTLMVGPVIQQDLADILMRFRIFRYVVTADIIKMYRQVLVDQSQTRLQRILWRGDPSSEIETYELTTVTYGTSSASFLATRCLKHLAEQHSSEYPVGSKHVQRDFYVDDLLTGADTLHEAKLIRDETIQLLRLGGFELSKWASNCSRLLEGVRGRDENSVTIGEENNSSILGIKWNQSEDSIHFSCEPNHLQGPVTKRGILSEIARLFDPLGLLGPIIVIAKLLLQELWQSGIHWDESVPQNVHSQWARFRSQLNSLNELQIPRCVKFNSDSRLVQMHGFCDASMRAYGACVYIRTRLPSNEYRTELLCAKSRVAPLITTSLPRLELSAALLLSRLVNKVSESLELGDVPIFLWSDSTITLNWISSPSRKWSIFVANRVGEVQRLTEISNWRHVASHDNPADLLSRGLNPSELASSSMWWHGPPFLQNEDHQWPSSSFTRLENDSPERKSVAATTLVNQSLVGDLLNRCSTLNKACRIISYCLRVFKKRRPHAPSKFISPTEMNFALGIICKAVQSQVFSSEYKALTEKNAISASSRILSLSPFLDEAGIIRVGGRLKNSNLSFDTRHPILLPRNHDLTRLAIEHEHVRNMHAGAQATMASVRERFWPLSLRSSTRKIIQKCVVCFKAKPRHSETLMGSLPASRVTVSRPFSHCGVDYAGPVILREGKRRNARNHKAYIAIFVCFATKAVHVELVSDLTTEAFIAAFKRFISRRGRPSHMYSDNGTNFVGAQHQLDEFYKSYLSQQTQSGIEQFLAPQGIAWRFIPPNAPHFGGLWEAAVKSAKYHMARIIGKAHLTFEEMQTTLCEIEAILNSRPITPLSMDPNDLSYLSPGHFLIGTTLNSFPCADLTDINENRLVRWQRVEQLRQHFWRRWSAEYLHSLQARTKWKNNKGPQLVPDQLVLVKQQNLAPLQWTLGRVQDVHPGSDNITRTATIRTAKGTFVRPLSRLAILPIDA